MNWETRRVENTYRCMKKGNVQEPLSKNKPWRRGRGEPAREHFKTLAVGWPCGGTDPRAALQNAHNLRAAGDEGAPSKRGIFYTGRGWPDKVSL